MILVLLFAFAVRLVYCLILFPQLLDKKGRELGWEMGGRLLEDPYSEIAKNIISGNGYVDDTGRINYARLPGYIGFLAVVYRLWGSERWKAQVFQSIIDTVSCLLVYLLSYRLTAERAVALLGAAFYAVYFKAISMVAQLFTEILYIHILLWFLWFFLVSFRKSHAAFPAGILLGIAALTKAVTLPFPLVVAVLYAWKLRRQSWSRILLLMLGFLPLVASLVARNYAWTGKIFFSTGGGEVLYKGTRFDYGKDFRSEQKRLIEEVQDGFSPQYSIGDDNRLKAMAFEVIAGDPGGYLKRVAYRLYLFWTYPDFSTRMMALKTVVVFAVNAFFIVCAALGFCRAKARHLCYQPFIWTILYFYSLHILIHSHSRYSLPLMPVIFIFAAFGLVDTVRKAHLMPCHPRGAPEYEDNAGAGRAFTSCRHLAV